MKKIFTASLLAVMLLLSVCFAASADTTANSDFPYEIGSSTKITIRSTEKPAVYFACTYINKSDVPVMPGLGTAELYDKTGNVLCSGSISCSPSVILPGETGYFNYYAYTSSFSDPDAEVADYSFTFEPFESSYYTFVSNKADCTLDRDNPHIFDGYPITIQIPNKTDKPLESLSAVAVLTNLQNGEPLWVTDDVTLYHILPVGSTVEVRCYIPESVMNLILQQAPDYSIEAMFFYPAD